MKIVKKDLKKGEISVIVENKEDLWYLNYLIDPEDHVKGKTVRKIKIGEEGARKQNVVKKPVFLELKTEKTAFEPEVLKVSGIIVKGPEDINRGSHHSFSIGIGTKISIIKKQWFKYQLEKIDEAARTEMPKILIVVHDREEAYFAMMQKYGYKLLGSLKGEVEKKAEIQTTKDFYREVAEKIKGYDKKYSLKSIIIASPAFFKENLIKAMGNSLIKKVVPAVCSSVGENGIKEVLKRDEAKTALKSERIREEMHLVENLLHEISRQGKAVYGIKETTSAVQMGAVKELMVSDSFILKRKEKEKFEEIDALMKQVEEMNGKVHIISSEHEGGEKLDGLGGIGAITRWQISSGQE